MPNPIIGMVGSAVIGGATSIIGGKMQADAAASATAAQVEGQREATAAQERMQEKAIAEQRDVFNQQKAALEPWQQAGLDAMNEITTGLADGSWDLSRFGFTDEDITQFGMGQLIQDPGYQFRLEQGQNALDMAAARAGKLVSGDQLIAASEYNQGMASQEFQNAFMRTASERDASFQRAAFERDTRYNALADIMDRGYGAATALSGVAGQMGDRVSGAYTNIGNALARGAENTGNAQAQGAINVGNAWNNALTGFATSVQQGIGNFMLYNRLQQIGGY